MLVLFFVLVIGLVLAVPVVAVVAVVCGLGKVVRLLIYDSDFRQALLAFIASISGCLGVYFLMSSTFGILVVLFLLVLFLLVTWNFQNEPKLGFRGLPWGTSIADMSGMFFMKSVGVTKFYFRKGDKLLLGDVKLSLISYGFYADRLCRVHLRLKDHHSAEAFVNIAASFFAPRPLPLKAAKDFDDSCTGNGKKYAWRKGTTLAYFEKGELVICDSRFAAIVEAEDKKEDNEKAQAGQRDFLGCSDHGGMVKLWPDSCNQGAVR